MTVTKAKKPISPERQAAQASKVFLESMVEAMRERRVKALEAEYQTYRAYREGPNLFVVVNYTKCTVYTVDIELPACNCQDFTMNGGDTLHVPCKHLLYVAHVLQGTTKKS